MKTNKLIFLFCILMSMLATNASAYEFAVKNADGVMIYYKYNHNKTEAYVTYKTDSYNSYSGSVVIPKEVTYDKKTLKVTTIDFHAFEGCTKLTSISIPNSIINIDIYAFKDCSSLKSVTIPNSVTNIGEEAFRGCFFLEKITSKISKTFAINDNTFQDYNATLYVPKGTVDKYKATDGWKKFFKNIVEEGTKTGIDDVEADNSLYTPKRIYDINGKCLPATSLDELPSGLYIVNGKKVVK